jgi:uncharacterized protein YdhG (YjbR/CyaY superfamily)
MKRDQTQPGTLDEYIEGFPPEIRVILEKIRTTIRKAVPDAEERISYRMPAFALNGILVYFAAFKRHIGLFPTPSGIAKFKRELSAYKGAKGSVQFPLDKPVPYALIGRIAKFRAAENKKVKHRKSMTAKGK